MTSWGVYLQKFSQGATLLNYIAKQMEGIWKNVMVIKRERVMKHLCGLRKHNLTKKALEGKKLFKTPTRSFLR